MKRSSTVHLFALAMLLCSAAALADGENTISKYAYIRPAPNIEKLVLAPRHLNVNLTNLSPDGEHFLISTTPNHSRVIQSVENSPTSKAGYSSAMSDGSISSSLGFCPCESA